MTKNKIIYILGSGHSGSTLLNKILGSSNKTFSVGELSQLKIFINKKEIYKNNHRPNKYYLCDCGKDLFNCKVWKNIVLNLDSTKLYPVCFSLKQKTRLLYNIILNNNTDDSFEELDLLYSLIFQNTNSSIIIDSSKNLAYLYYLKSSIKNVEICVIHLIRDGRGVLNSYEKMNEFWLFKYFNWLCSNLLMSYYIKKNFNKKSYFQLSYDQFAKNPKKYVNILNKKFDLNIDEENYIENINNTKSHNFAGNKMRWKKIKSIKYDQSWKKRMPKWKQYLLTVLCYIPNKMWVYRK